MANDPNAMLREASANEIEQRNQQKLVLSPVESEKTKKTILSHKSAEEMTRKKEAVDTKPLAYDEKAAQKRAEELKKSPISGNYDAKHIKDINKYILQDSKALRGGEYRQDNGDQLRDRRVFGTDKTFKMQFEKGVIDDARLNAIMKDFGTVENFAKLDDKMAAEKLSKLYGNLEKLGAFEKGNSKTARTYAEQIATSAGYTVDWSKINKYEKERAEGLAKNITLEPQQTKNEKVVVKEKIEPKIKTETKSKVAEEIEKKAVQINNEFKQSPYATGKQLGQQKNNDVVNKAARSKNIEATKSVNNKKSPELKAQVMAR